MIYHLNEKQFASFWKITLTYHNTQYDREYSWKKSYQKQFNLKYSENINHTEPGFYGTLEGDEKFINFFLLQL